MTRNLLAALSIILCCFISCNVHHEISVDAEIPAGNIVFEKMSGDTVYVHQDLRDTKGDWFYWAFRVKGAQGRRLTFVFTESVAVGVRGPVVTLDKGETFCYPAERGATRRSFSYEFPSKAKEVWFYECFPYLPQRWESFVGRQSGPEVRTETICQSRGGRDVPVCFFGRDDAPHRAVISARHHCSESIASYVVEGIATAFMADDALGEWLRQNMQLVILPFTDMDGVVAGDQGKNRVPHDHNRDYTEFIYPETRALADLLVSVKPLFFLDIHCPWLYGGCNEYIYTPWKDPSILPDADAESEFSRLLELNQRGGLRYKASDDLPFGVSWNTGANYAQGLSCIQWAAQNVPSLHICRSLEVPFANANGAVVTPEALLDFGGGVAATFKALMESRGY